MNCRRVAMSLIGVVITAISVAILKFSALGVDSFQTFMAGADFLIPISFGTLYVIVNAVLLIFALVFDRHYIGISTFINLFLLGYIVEFTLNLLTSLFPTASLPFRGVMFVAGFVFLCLGCSLYITADLGVSTYDAIALICSNKWKLCKFKYMRICTDLICLFTGTAMFLLSGHSIRQIGSLMGIGTVLTAFCMGPLIDFFDRKVSKPFLAKGKIEKCTISE